MTTTPNSPHVFDPTSPMMQRVRAMSDADLAKHYVQPLMNAVRIERARRAGADTMPAEFASLQTYLEQQA